MISKYSKIFQDAANICNYFFLEEFFFLEENFENLQNKRSKLPRKATVSGFPIC